MLIYVTYTKLKVSSLTLNWCYENTLKVMPSNFYNVAKIWSYFENEYARPSVMSSIFVYLLGLPKKECHVRKKLQIIIILIIYGLLTLTWRSYCNLNCLTDCD